MSVAIDCQDLIFAYGGGKPVLSLSALTVQRGERVFVFGPSGSGKTTLLGLVAGILQPSAGKLAVLGNDFTKLSGRQRDRIRGVHFGYIFQQFNLIPYLNVLENIILPCRLNSARRQRLGVQRPEEKAQELADHLDIAGLLETSVLELSVGQQQRVAAARALLGAPELIIADEPTSALDADRRTGFLQVLFREAAAVQSTILFVSHDRSLAPLFDRQIDLPALNAATGGMA